MTSPLVLAAAPKAQSAPEVVAKVEPAARAARVEATHKKKRVTQQAAAETTTGRATAGRETVIPVRSVVAHSSAASEHGS